MIKKGNKAKAPRTESMFEKQKDQCGWSSREEAGVDGNAR